MAKGSAWKSQFLLSAIVFVVGMMATLCFSYFFYQRSEKDWNIRVDQTAERLSNTLLSWLEESYAPVSGLVALVENSNTVEPNEFLNAFESMQSRSTTVLLDEASLLRLNRVGQWQVIISSDALGYPGRYITLADVASTLSLASKRQNQFTLSPPFKSESGRTISAIALSASAAGEPTIVVGTLNYDTLFEGMRSGPVPKGIFLKLSGRFLGRPDLKSVVTPPNDRQFQHISTTRVATAGADIEISWAATREFDGGPFYGVALAGLLGGISLTTGLSLFIGFLIRRNRQIERKVDEATLALRKSSESLGRERALLRSLIDSIPDLIFAKDIRGVYITSNKAFAKLLGRTADDVVGKTDLDIFPADLAVSFRERDADMVRAGAMTTNEEEITYPDGRVAQVETSKTPFIADDGELYGLIGVSRDITERKKTERVLAIERERLQRILDASPVGVAITSDNVARFTNPRMEEMFALRVGSAVPDLYVFPEQRNALLNELDRAGIVRDFGVQLRGRNGEMRDSLTTLMHMEYEGRRGMLGWVVDVTELKKIQTALSEAKVAAEDATKIKAQFLANMSHEIRTPMNAVIGLAHLCLKTDLSAKQRDYVGKIHNAGTSLLSIINDILDFSKIEAGKLDIENVTFEIDSVMNNIATMVAQKIQDKDLELLFDISPDIPPALLGDPLRLGQVLINLLGNAVKFTETGEICLIGELLERTGNKVKLQFSVKDTGIGMTKEQANRLFQAFSQADTSTSRKYGGTGLGLAISKRLVELMGGSIWVVSEPGEGSTFSFTGWFGLSEAVPRRVVPTRLGSLKTLIVDDNAAAREVLEDLLSTVGGEIEQVASGAEAIDAVKHAEAGRPFDLVLLDWRMPGLDGVATARRIRADGLLKHVPAIVIVTAFGREEVHTEAEGAGVDGFLVKPVNRSMLVNMLVEIFAPEHRAAAREAIKATAYELNGLRVLLAEDNTINQQIAVELLEGVGVSIDVANNGREALNMLLADGGNTRYDVVLMDLQMPEMDGYQATARIRAAPSLAELPIIAMTAHATAEERDRCLTAGMRGHITKPIDPELLYRTLVQFHRPDQAAVAAKPVSRFSHAAELSEIAGIDVADGLNRVAGNRKLYRSLLGQFVDQQADAVSAIRASLAREDFVLAERFMHTLKGVSGNLGAKALSGLAAELERSLKDRNARSLEAGLSGLAAELAPTMEAIRNFLAAGATDAPLRTSISDSAETVTLLRHLKQMLANDDGAALDYLLQARERIGGVISEADLDSLQKVAGDFDFSAALECLTGIAQRYNFSLEYRMSHSDRKTILIVDDTPTNIGIISSVLKDSFRTKVATNGEKALVLASADDRPDLILLDITMPGMDGYEVCRRLKANPATRGIPVIFLTAKTESDDEKQGFEVGAVDYIHKPFSAPIVLARVNTHIALQAALQQAREAQKQADELLHCLLPEAAAAEIRDIGTVIPRRYDNVAVLFCDVVNFTSYCDKHEPEDVVSRLDALFIAFERVAAAHGLEKIKTIGDAFMAAAGLLRETDDPLGSAVLCGLQMATTSIDAQLGWAVRVGVHVGPVVAGIVGQERYQFDIWGDTVNIAARMAGRAMPGSVAVTYDIWVRIKDRFESESLGELEIKGKGTIPVVAVRREKPRL